MSIKDGMPWLLSVEAQIWYPLTSWDPGMNASIYGKPFGVTQPMALTNGPEAATPIRPPQGFFSNVPQCDIVPQFGPPAQQHQQHIQMPRLGQQPQQQLQTQLVASAQLPRGAPTQLATPTPHVPLAVPAKEAPPQVPKATVAQQARPQVPNATVVHHDHPGVPNAT